MNYLKNALALHDMNPKLHRDDTQKVFIQSHGMAALCKRNRALGEERKRVGKQTAIWLHKNKYFKSVMIKVFNWRITPRTI